MDILKLVQNRIRELIAQHNTTMYEVAIKGGFPQSTIKNIMVKSGQSTNPGIVTIKHICDGLGISLYEFFDTDEFRAATPEKD